MRLYSWNVNGARAVLKKGFLDWFRQADADVVCLQETKAHPAVLPPELLHMPGYHVSYSSGEKKGYSGVGTFSRQQPQGEERGYGLDPIYDCEGRILTQRFADFTLLNVYFPNGKASDARLDYKMGFYDATLAYCERLRQRGERLVICGDYNTAHEPIDLARPKENETISGFLRIERDWLDRWQAHGYVDAFRRLHPEAAERYSWWSMRSGARARNVGWRIDYFWVTEDLWEHVSGADIHEQITGSDHCPISLDLAF